MELIAVAVGHGGWQALQYVFSLTAVFSVQYGWYDSMSQSILE